ncbi:hypothetical protein D3C81_496910 [compost metagenome]
MKVKIECVGDDWGFYQIIDVTEFFNDIVNSESLEEANKYFAEGTYYEDSSDGTYAASYIENLGQSDWCPPQLYHKEFKVVITHIK